jgi:IS5 family transposase
MKQMTLAAIAGFGIERLDQPAQRRPRHHPFHLGQKYPPPQSTKNAKKARDPEMHQTKKGNQWYFGMKAHIGIDSRTKLIHAAVATPANVAGPICCTGTKPACGATKRIAASGP